VFTLEKDEIFRKISETLSFDGETIEIGGEILENFSKEELESILEGLLKKREQVNNDNLEWLIGLSNDT